jgi:hypothetical protein
MLARSGALNGTAPEYQNNNFRAASVATYAAVYGWIYILHEADAGLLYLSGISSPLRNITRSPPDAGSELGAAATAVRLSSFIWWAQCHE